MDLDYQVDKFRKRFAEVEQQLGDPVICADSKKMQELGKEHARLRKLVDCAAALDKTRKSLAENRELIAEGGDDELIEMAKAEIEPLEAQQEKLLKDLRLGIVPPRTHG
ncbi:PCRF domain-containing protein [Oscillatoria amoena NRMC-F 0135]|nr:PCRF domain-containing protein [Oscillatoria amoena NRMC-F 0135]